MRKLLFTFVTILFCLNMNSQNNEGEALAYNIGLGSIVGGIGAVINKEEDKKIHKAFLKGFWQGAIGGYLVYEGKKRIYDFKRTQDYKYAWGSKLLYSAGNSIIENAASDNDFWVKWNLTLGFNRIEFETDDKFRINYQLMPVSLIGTLHYATRGKFNLKESARTGIFIFTTKKKENLLNSTGQASRNNILLLDSGDEFFNSLPHEIIHTYQHQDFQNLNTFFNKGKKNLLKNRFLKKIDEYIYFDLHSFVLDGIYYLERSEECYYNNLFEQEANFYSSRRSCN